MEAVAELVDNSTTGTIDENDPGYGAVQSRANAVSESGGHKLTNSRPSRRVFSTTRIGTKDSKRLPVVPRGAYRLAEIGR